MSYHLSKQQDQLRTKCSKHGTMGEFLTETMIVTVLDVKALSFDMFAIQDLQIPLLSLFQHLLICQLILERQIPYCLFLWTTVKWEKGYKSVVKILWIKNKSFGRKKQMPWKNRETIYVEIHGRPVGVLLRLVPWCGDIIEYKI